VAGAGATRIPHGHWANALTKVAESATVAAA